MQPGKIDVAEVTIKNRNERITQLYEQGADNDSVGEYFKRWWQWVGAGLGDVKEEIKKAGAMMPLPDVGRGVSSLFFFPSDAYSSKTC